MGVREWSRWHGAAAVPTLRAHWRTASLAAGWPFPGDWALPEVDRLCLAASRDQDLDGPLAELGRARASAGAGLRETIADLAALHAVLQAGQASAGMVGADPDALPGRLLRVAAVGWADVALRGAQRAEVTDALTGLTTPAYLRTRLREVYADARARGVPAGAGSALVVVTLDTARSPVWSRLAALVLLGDVLRGLFDGGETVAALGPSALAALCPADERLAQRAESVRHVAADRFAVDPHLRALGEQRVWTEHLPASHDEACRLLAALGRR